MSLYRTLLTEDLHPIVMKGFVYLQIYGELAGQRPSGDVDILIEKKSSISS